MSTINCKNCKKEFDNAPIKAWGQEITPVRCAECRHKNAMRQIQEKKGIANFGMRLERARLEHDKLNHRGLNAGGYCIDCNYGTDWS